MAVDFSILATGALSFTVALAWNRAVSKLIEGHYPAADKPASARAALVAAILITIMVIVFVEALNRAHRILAPGPRPTGKDGPHNRVVGAGPPFGDGGADGLAWDTPVAGFEAQGRRAPGRAATRRDCDSCVGCAHCHQKSIVHLWDD